MKTLYFEGAGWSGAESSKATIGNCRIRTAFYLDDGRAVYLEMVCSQVAKGHDCYVGHVMHCHYLTGSDDDCNVNRLDCERKVVIPYTEICIKELVNSLGASFDGIKVLPDFSGYRVFGKRPKTYNYGDEFMPNWEAIRRANEAKEFYKKLDKEQKNSNYTSLWIDEEKQTVMHLQRYYNGSYHHLVIDLSVDNWHDTRRELTPAEIAAYKGL